MRKKIEKQKNINQNISCLNTSALAIWESAREIEEKIEENK